MRENLILSNFIKNYQTVKLIGKGKYKTKDHLLKLLFVLTIKIQMNMLLKYLIKNLFLKVISQIELR